VDRTYKIYTGENAGGDFDIMAVEVIKGEVIKPEAYFITEFQHNITDKGEITISGRAARLLADYFSVK
jgi:hypothetical protein